MIPFSPEHTLIHLGLHNYDELHSALKILDLGLVLTRLRLDWDRFLQETTRFGCQAPSYIMLRSLARVFPRTVPDLVLAHLGHFPPSSMQKLALSPTLERFTRLLAPLYHHRRLSDWAAYLGALLWPSQDYLPATFGIGSRTARLCHIWEHLSPATALHFHGSL
jgi:hypothetical protein